MFDIENVGKEKAILVGLRTPDLSKEKLEEHLDELEMLAETAGAEAVFKVTQDRGKRDPAYFIGKGKGLPLSEIIPCSFSTLTFEPPRETFAEPLVTSVLFFLSIPDETLSTPAEVLTAVPDAGV